MNICEHKEFYAVVTGHAHKLKFEVCKNCYDIINENIKDMLKLKKEAEK